MVFEHLFHLFNIVSEGPIIEEYEKKNHDKKNKSNQPTTLIKEATHINEHSQNQQYAENQKKLRHR